MVDVIRQHIEIIEGAGGPKARIAGSRIRVQDIVVWHELLGMSPDEVVNQHPTITVADVHAAFAYYWDHRDEIEEQMATDDAFVKELKRIDPGPLQRKLRLHRSE